MGAASKKIDKSLVTEEIVSILRKNYCHNNNFYYHDDFSNGYELAHNIMKEMVGFAEYQNKKDINKNIGLISFDELCRYLNHVSGQFVVLTLDVYGLDFLGRNFGQNAINYVLKKVVEIAYTHIDAVNKCCLDENGKLVFLLEEAHCNNPEMRARKIISAINSTMVFTHNHLFTVKVGADIFAAQTSKEAQKYLLEDGKI
ncbi:MAG: hypothetical protein AB7U85_08590 [Alphaproteobacteria bacterium]